MPEVAAKGVEVFGTRMLSLDDLFYLDGGEREICRWTGRLVLLWMFLEIHK